MSLLQVLLGFPICLLLVHYLLLSVCDSPLHSSLLVTLVSAVLSLPLVSAACPVLPPPSSPLYSLFCPVSPPAHLGYLACSLSFRHLDLIHIHIHTPTTHPPPPTHTPSAGCLLSHLPPLRSLVRCPLFIKHCYPARLPSRCLHTSIYSTSYV